MNATQESDTRKTIFLKDMVSKSCIRLVISLLDKIPGIQTVKVDLGKAIIDVMDQDVWNETEMENELKDLGFSVVHDKQGQLVEQIKSASIELIHFYNNANSLIRNSDYLSEKTGFPYHQLSKIFSDKVGITLEKYIILLKIEKVKELLSYDEYTVSEISFRMGYSSVQYLSNQFKQITGYSVTEYKKMENKKRFPIEVLV